MRTLLTTAVLTVLLSSAGLAQEGPPLSDDRINGFIASIVALEEWGENHEEEVDALEDVFDGDAMGDISNPFAAATRMIEAQSWSGEVVDIVQDHGFSGLEDWARTGNRIFMAFMAVQMDVNKVDMEAGLAEALKQIENSDMTEDQKAQTRQMLMGANQMASIYANVPQADKKAVAPFLEKLENMGNSAAGSYDQ
ncbi:MAG: hypothetical protein KJO98_07285 [Rhodothermia bacterium]|nr:hypothetical protein [Rhodothermia bacterium]